MPDSVEYNTVRDAITRLEDVNRLGKSNLSDKGVELPSELPTTLEIVNGIEQIGTGSSLNIEFSQEAPEDTSMLWIKSAEPENVTVDYDIDNGIESIQQMPVSLPQSANDITCGVVGTKCYLFGGAYSFYYNTIYIYNTETDTISLSQTSLPVTLADAACGVVGNKCYIFGGYSGSSKSRVNTIYVYDTETDTITTSSTTMPSAISSMACGVIGTKCYLFGGSTGSAQTTIYVFDTNTETLTTLQTQLPSALTEIVCGVVGTKCYIFGGGSASIVVFDSDTQSCITSPTTLPTSGTYKLACGVIGTNCYIFGGHDRGNWNAFDTIIIYNSETDTAEVSTTKLLKKHYSISCGVVGNRCYLFGGGGNTINKFTVTFPLQQNDIYIQEDTLKNQFTLISEPTKVVTGVSNVYVGNSNNEAEKCEAYLHDGTAWQEI